MPNREDEAVVLCTHGAFMVFNKDSALRLRRQRILGQLAGCSPSVPHQLVESGFPYLLSHYGARLASEKKLAQFKQIVADKEATSEQDNALRFQDNLKKLQEEAREKYKENRLAELAARNLEPTPRRMGRFDENKLRLKVEPIQLDSSQLEPMEVDEVRKHVIVDQDKFLVFTDLYDRGFYISSGTKFGCDFLCYVDDPMGYHAQYAIKVISSDISQEKSKHPLTTTSLNYNEINALNRLTRGAKKSLLLATLDHHHHHHHRHSSKVQYWALSEGRFLDPHFTMEAFKPIEPTMELHSAGDTDETPDNIEVSLNPSEWCK